MENGKDYDIRAGVCHIKQKSLYRDEQRPFIFMELVRGRRLKNKGEILAPKY